MSALNRITCPECTGEVLLLRGAATRRWRCCHCQGLIDLDVLEGGTFTPPNEPMEPCPLEWEPLPTAHTAPSPAKYLGPASTGPAAAESILEGRGAQTERGCAANEARRRVAISEAHKRSRVISVVSAIFGALAIMVFLYPAGLEVDAILPPLNAYFHARPVLFPYFLLAPRAYLIALLLFSAHGIYYGRSWAPGTGLASMLVLCIAFNFHPAAAAIAAAMLAPLWVLRRMTPARKR